MRQDGWNQSVTHFRNVLKGAFLRSVLDKALVRGSVKILSKNCAIGGVPNFYLLLTLLCNLVRARWTKTNLSLGKPSKIRCALASIGNFTRSPNLDSK